MADASVDVPVLPPEEALAFFRKKGFAFSFAWQDVWQAEHARAFTVAKAMSRDLLEDIRAAVDAAIADGTTLKDFQDRLRPQLEVRGWWGKKLMVDPLTGEKKLVQLGSPRRLKTILNVNMRVAYETGRWDRIRRTQSAFPFLRYTSVMDGRERPEHHAWHGTILPVDDPWWETHAPPCGWNCRCTVQSFNQRQLNRRGLSLTASPVRFKPVAYTNKRTGEVMHIERGIDPGWGYHVGKAPLEGLAPLPLPRNLGNPEGNPETASMEAPASNIAFLQPFGLGPNGGVFVDKAGWPLAMTGAWLRGLSFDRQAQAAGVAKVIADPDAIGLVWVTGKDGRAMLMRRYRRGAMTVDIGGAGWRFTTLPQPLASGVIIWNRDQATIASRNYHRDAWGRFASSGHSLIDAAADVPHSSVKSASLGHLDDRTMARLEAIGAKPGRSDIRVEHGRLRHALNRHGSGGQSHGAHVIGGEDLRRIPELLNRSTQIKPARHNKNGNQRFEAVTLDGARRFVIIGESRRKGVTIITIRKH